MRSRRSACPPSDIENALRAELQRSQVAYGLRVSEFLTPAEKTRLQKLATEQREVRYGIIPADKFVAEAKVDEAAVEAYYKANQARFMTPEFVQLAYGELRLDQVASQVQVSGRGAEGRVREGEGFIRAARAAPRASHPCRVGQGRCGGPEEGAARPSRKRRAARISPRWRRNTPRMPAPPGRAAISAGSSGMPSTRRSPMRPSP